MPTTIITINARFPLGQTVATPGAIDTFTPAEIAEAIQRHAKGDCGEICEDDRKENELSLKEGFRLMSVYTFRKNKLWIITESDRSVTTALLPDEY